MEHLETHPYVRRNAIHKHPCEEVFTEKRVQFYNLPEKSLLVIKNQQL